MDIDILIILNRKDISQIIWSDEEETVFGSDMTKLDTDGDGKIGMAEAVYAIQKVAGRCGLRKE